MEKDTSVLTPMFLANPWIFASQADDRQSIAAGIGKESNMRLTFVTAATAWTAGTSPVI